MHIAKLLITCNGLGKRQLSKQSMLLCAVPYAVSAHSKWILIQVFDLFDKEVRRSWLATTCVCSFTACDSTR